MTRILITLFCLFVTLSGFSAVDTTRVNELNKHAWDLKFSNPDSATLLSKQALKLATDGGFVKGEAEALKNLGVLQHIAGNLDSAFYYADAAYGRYAEFDHTIGMAASTNLKGLIHYSRGNYAEALKLYIEVARLFEAANDLVGLARVYNNIGSTLYKQEEDKDALIYYQKAYDLHIAQQNKQGQMEALSNMGMVQMEMKQYQEALSNYGAAEAFARETNNKRLLGNILQNMAICFRYQQDNRKAEQYYRRSLDLKKGLNDVDGICTALTGLAIIAKEDRQYAQALTLLKEVETTASSAGLLDRLSNAYEIQYQVYELSKQPAEALRSFKNYAVLKDSLFNLDKAKLLRELQVKYETEKKEQEIVALKKEADFQTAMKNRAIVLAIALAVVLALAIYGFRLRAALFKSRNETLEFENRYKEQENLRLAEELRAEAEINRVQAEKHTLEIDFKNRELTSAALYAVQKNEILLDLKERLEELSDNGHATATKPLIKLIDSNLNVDQDWENTKLHFERVHPDFFERLQSTYPDLTQTELKHIAYIKVNLSGKEIARLLNIGVKAIQMSRYRIKKKIGLPEEVNLLEYIQNF